MWDSRFVRMTNRVVPCRQQAVNKFERGFRAAAKAGALPQPPDFSDYQ